MTQPNEQLIETIEKALEAVTQGKWVDCSWDVMERPHVFAKELQTGHYCNGKADLPQTPADCHLIANAPEWLRALLEENKRLDGMFFDANRRAAISKISIDELYSQLQQTREELEQWKKHAIDFEEMYKEEHRKKNESNRIIEQVKAERDDYRRVLQFSSSLDARSILSQYRGESHE